MSDNVIQEYRKLFEQVLDANLMLPELGLVLWTWGNVSAVDREHDLMVIKASGVPYDGMSMESLVGLRLSTGEQVAGNLRPSSDTQTHLELYRAFETIGGICHTHSFEAVARAQARLPLTAYGTTHADYFYHDVPLTRALTSEEMATAYETNTGKVIIERFAELASQEDFATKISPANTPAVLVAGHGPFAWGKDAHEAVFHASVLEAACEMARMTESLNPKAKRIEQALLDQHYLRKHGPNAYYGQE